MQMKRGHAALGLCVLVAMTGCGGTPQRAPYCAAPTTMTRGSEAVEGEVPQSQPETQATDAVSEERHDREPECIPRGEAPPYQLIAYESPPTSAPEVILAELDMPPGAYFRPPVSSCQDVIVLVRDGELEAVGTGIAPSLNPTSLYAGDAVRFGPEGDGLLTNTSGASAHTILAVARDQTRFQRSGNAGELEPQGGDCAERVASAPTSTLRVGSLSTTESIAVSADLSIQIVLDPDQAGAENASLSVLHGTSSYAIPSHANEGSAEVIFVENGAGVMSIGEREVAVHPGSAIYIPRGVTYAFAPDQSAPFHAIQLYAPAGPEQRNRTP